MEVHIAVCLVGAGCLDAHGRAHMDSCHMVVHGLGFRHWHGGDCRLAVHWQWHSGGCRAGFRWHGAADMVVHGWHGAVCPATDT